MGRRYTVVAAAWAVGNTNGWVESNVCNDNLFVHLPSMSQMLTWGGREAVNVTNSAIDYMSLQSSAA